jgi:hypothetical protein
VILLVLLVPLVLFAIAFGAARQAGSVEPSRPDISALWRQREAQRARRREQARQRRLPPLPEQDAPPPGLAPLVPSPRAVRVEAARGIRELEDWLADQTSA